MVLKLSHKLQFCFCFRFFNFVRKKNENFQLINGHFTTIYGHFSVNCNNFFHKAEVQTVILRCLVYLYLNWIKSYNINNIFFSYFLQFWKKKTWKFMTHEWPFMTISGHFFCQLHENLSQNWGSAGHFEVLCVSKS